MRIKNKWTTIVGTFDISSGEFFVAENTIDISYIKNREGTELERKDISENEVSFLLPRTILFVPFTAFVTIKHPNIIFYKLRSQYLLTSVILVLTLSAVISRFTMSSFLFYAALFTSFFLAINYVHARSILKKIFVQEEVIEDGDIPIELQKEWMTNPNKCPACGNDISTYDHVCSDCGLRIRDKVKMSRFSHTGRKQKMMYIYKEKTETNKHQK